MIRDLRFRSAPRSDAFSVWRASHWFLTAAVCCLLWSPATAQDSSQVLSPVLTIDSERLYTDSAFGRRTAAEFETLGAELTAENRRIEDELAAEEKQLTALRATLPAAEFRVLADAFDEKVQSVRKQQDGKSRNLTKAFEDRRIVFLNAAVPVLETLMREAGAAVVLERRSVFLSANSIDITREAIDRLDEKLAADLDPAENK